MAADSSLPYQPPRGRARASIEFSLNGLLFIGLSLFMALAAINSQANLLFGVFGLMIGVMIVSISISRLVLMKLGIVRVLPDHAVVGQRVTLTYEITNRKRYWPSLSVMVAERDVEGVFTKPPIACMLHAAPKTTATVPTELIARRRGVHALSGYTISTSFPFGFVKRVMQHADPDNLLVYPAIGQVDPKLLLRFSAAEKSGAMLRPRRGGTDEFYGVKEYRTGENPRHIHWKRSARTGVLVSKEMTLVSPPRIMLLVDTYQKEMTTDATTRVEMAIAMAGSLASHALEAGLMVGLYAWADEWVALAPSRGKRHRRELMTVLARLPVNRTHDSARLMDGAQAQITTGTTPVMTTPMEVDSGRSDPSRGGVVVLSSATPQGRSSFTFDPEINFSVAPDPKGLAQHRRSRLFSF
jgi:uncharacterized protein (DUF58 family)